MGLSRRSIAATTRWRGWTYNNRLQATSISVGTAGTPRSVFGADLDDCPNHVLGCATNNGNLISATLPVVGGEQAYGYATDHLNRLITASETLGQASQWAQT